MFGEQKDMDNEYYKLAQKAARKYGRRVLDSNELPYIVLYLRRCEPEVTAHIINWTVNHADRKFTRELDRLASWGEAEIDRYVKEHMNRHKK